MISALLYAKNLNKIDQKTTNTTPSSSTTTTTATAGTSATKILNNRLLVCAPSNGAVDELLSRLLEDGIINAKGKFSKPKMVRLGKPLDGSPPKIDSLTLDTQIEAAIMTDPIWAEFNKSTLDYSNCQK